MSRDCNTLVQHAATFETLNTLGLPLYVRTIPDRNRDRDRDRDKWVRIKIESNPPPICTRSHVSQARLSKPLHLVRMPRERITTCFD